MEQITFDIHEGYKLTLDNKDTCMGCYYPEDDWKLTYYGESQVELLDQYLWDVDRIQVAGSSLERVKYIIHEGKRIEIEEVEYLDTWSNKEWSAFIMDILNHDRVFARQAELKAAREQAEAEAKIQREAENRRATIEKEKQLLIELKAKYEL